MSDINETSTRRRNLPLVIAFVTAFALLFGAAGLAMSPPAKATSKHGPRPTVVLVHGAFADSSGWNDVTRRLQLLGYPVLARANPLRGVASDAAYLTSVLATIPGPIVLVGHSYGGMVISAAAVANPNVKALVYVAAFAPDQGETLHGLQVKFPGSKLSEAALDFRPYLTPLGKESYDGYVKAEVFRDVFAADLPLSTTKMMAASQRPGDVHTLDEQAGPAAWKTIPSFFLIARDDNLIPAAVQRFMADRAGARKVEVDSSHVAMMSKPDATVALIIAASVATVR